MTIQGKRPENVFTEGELGILAKAYAFILSRIENPQALDRAADGAASLALAAREAAGGDRERAEELRKTFDGLYDDIEGALSDSDILT